MIDKIQNIENVGRMVKTGGNQQCYHFDKNTHIYAANTHGKSTFTAIIRSLQTNNPDFIKGRKTFGATQQQRVVLNIGGTNSIFNGSSWNSQVENIRIFDTRYIHENFFSPEEEIADDGQKKIETFILGSEGVRLARDVVDLTNKQKENANAMSAITREYNSGNPYDYPAFDEFLGIDQIEDVETFIDEQTKQLNSYKNQESVKGQLATLLESLKQPHFTDYKTKLGTKLTVDIAQITNHIHTRMSENVHENDAKEFLRQGVRLQKDDATCPFCAQPIENNEARELLKAYSEYFSSTYNDMANNRQVCEVFFAGWDVVSKLRKGVIELARLDVKVDLGGADDRLDDAIKSFAEEIAKKKDFAHEVDFSQLDVIESESTALITALESLLEQYEGDLTDKVQAAKDTLKSYELAQKRHTEPWTSKCGEYLGLKNLNDTDVTPKLTAAVAAQSTYANSVYTNCMASVNECLEALGVNFRVQNLSYRGRTRNDLFSLVFDETHAVGIATTSQTSSHTSKHTLSESDRRALCFAFFTSSVINDPACADLIVILDDPVSSFDTDRRNNTVKYLKRMRGSGSTPDQVIILTHDKDFLRTLGSDIRDDAKTLILEWNPTTSTSDFKELDTSNHQLFMDDYYRRLNELERFLLLPDSELNIGHLQNVRHIIENVMKRKYYRLLSNDIRDNKSLETFINTLSLPGSPYENSQRLIDDIRSLLPHQVHHDQDNPGGYDVNALGSADIRRIITDALAIIQRL